MTISESTVNRICLSDLVPVSSCIDDVCSRVFKSSPSCSLFSDVNVTVSAVNQLGSGQSSNPVKIGNVTIA